MESLSLVVVFMASIQKWRRDGPSHRVNASMNICMENVYKQFSCWRRREIENGSRVLKWRRLPFWLPFFFLLVMFIWKQPRRWLTVFQLLFAERYRQTVMCSTMSHPMYTFIPLSTYRRWSYCLGNSTCSALCSSLVSLSALATQTVRCWTPSRWLPHSLPLFHFLPPIYIYIYVV